MSTNYLNNNYLLTSSLAEDLYHKYAENCPVIDYHCHLQAKDIYENKPLLNIASAWLGGDHYKWRLLRARGVEEKYITGNASLEEKFVKYASEMPYFVGNPIYLWSHMELQKYCNINVCLNKNNALEVYNSANKIFEKKCPQDLIKESNVKVICTTDDPVDDLKYHILLKDNNFNCKVLPSFRPDNALKIYLPTFASYIKKLEALLGKEISNVDELVKALDSRLIFFKEVGCKVSDHSLEGYYYVEPNMDIVNSTYKNALKGVAPSMDDANMFISYVMAELGKLYRKYGIAQQLHIGALRNNSTRMFEKLGPDTGYDSMDNKVDIRGLSKLLNKMDSTNELPKTVLYSLDETANRPLAALMACFQEEGVQGKMQLGAAWWFNDQETGIRKHLEDLASQGLVSNFIGMLTDSRSFLSYTRHDYFRRVLCTFLADEINKNRYPNDIDTVGQIIQDICVNNPVKYFGF